MKSVKESNLAAIYIKGGYTPYQRDSLVSASASMGYKVFDVYTDDWSDDQMLRQLVVAAQRNCFQAVIFSESGLVLTGNSAAQHYLALLKERGISLYLIGGVIFKAVYGSKGVEWRR